MFILTRKVGETIMIGDNIKIVIAAQVGKKVRLGIEAPKHIAIYREEVYNKINEQKTSETIEENHETI